MSRFGWLLVLIPAVLLLFTPYMLWYGRPLSPWRVVVVDKTVPHLDYREHGALYWVLEHSRVLPPDDLSTWRVDRGFEGHHPEAKLRARKDVLDAADLQGANMLFLADTYGVYTGDYADGRTEDGALDYSRKLYGGLNLDEVEVIEDFSARGGAVVGEFNTFASPTHGEPRRRLEKVFGARWTEWAGRFFIDLGDVREVPAWARRHWKQQHGTAWQHHGPGYLFAHEDTRVVVLHERTDVGYAGLQITDYIADDRLMLNVGDEVQFRYWFDILVPDEESEVLAWYVLDTTPTGEAQLKAEGIPTRFPAIVRAAKRPLRLYFAGDFSDNDLSLFGTHLLGWPGVRRFFSHLDVGKDQTPFLWQIYLPLMTNVLDLVPEEVK